MIKFKRLPHEDLDTYTGRCRHCSYVAVWELDKDPDDYEGPPFRAFVMTTKYPTFVAPCPCCGNNAVFDLTAF